MHRTLGVPSAAGEIDEDTILTTWSALSERDTQEHKGDPTLPGDGEKDFKIAMIGLGFEERIEVYQVN